MPGTYFAQHVHHCWKRRNQMIHKSSSKLSLWTTAYIFNRVKFSIYLEFVGRKLIGKSLSGWLEVKCFLKNQNKFCSLSWFVLLMQSLESFANDGHCGDQCSVPGIRLPKPESNYKLRECQVFKSMLNMCCSTSKEKSRGCTWDTREYRPPRQSPTRIVEGRPF